jgi:hypothetical protein
MLALAVVYIALFAAYALLPHERTAPNVQCFLTLVSVHTLLGAWLLVLLRRTPTRLFVSTFGDSWFWLALVLMPRVLVFPMLPWLSDDVYRYLWDGKVLLHAINPYPYAPSAAALAAVQHSNAALYALLDYKTYGTVYPPLAQGAFALAAWAGGWLSASWQSAFFAWKILAISAELCGLWCVWKLLRGICAEMSSLAFYACLPLPAVELAGQGHVDALLIAPLGAVLLLLTQTHTKGQTARTAALLGLWTAVLGGIKILPAALALPLLRWLPTWKLRGTLILSVIIVSVAVFTPLLGDAQAQAMFLDEARITSIAFQFNGGLYYALCYVLGWGGVQEFWRFSPVLLSWLRVLATLAVGLFTRVQNARVQDKNSVQLWNALLFTLAAVLLVSSKVHTWYFVPLLLVNILTHHIWLLMLASGSMLSYSYYAVEPSAEQYALEMCVWAASALVFAFEQWRLLMPPSTHSSLHS